jgi:hypothetical protein
MHTLNWSQVHAWRLAQHGLAPRLKQGDFTTAVTRTGGIQAQVMSAAELALCTRVDGLTPAAVKSALWQDHTLVKTWAMRGTLHLLAASALPLYVAARSFHDQTHLWDKYFAYYGFSPAQQEAYLAAIPQVLGKEPMTREQLASAVAKEIGAPGARELILASNWGSPLKPSAFRGDLCFGPSQGQQVTFVNPRAWLGDWQTSDPQQALQTIARRYLQAYGPATPNDFARWWGLGKVPAKKLFQSLAEELEEVDVEGWRALVLRATLEPMQHLEGANTVHLLPLFDSYTIVLGYNNELLLARAYQSQVFRPQGWISAVVLVNGAVQGVWQYTTQSRKTVVKVQMFAPTPAWIQQGIEAEVARLSACFKAEPLIEYAA